MKATFGLNDVGVGAISGVREGVSGIVTMPGGILVERLRRHWGMVLALSMGGFGFGWLMIGLAPVYPLLLFGMVLVSVSAAMWHLPAMAALSRLYPKRRGTVLSFHAVGGSIGDVIAPPLTGLLLLVLTWQNVISIYALGPMILVFAVIWAFRNVGRLDTGNTGPEEATPASFKEQLENTKPLL
ncbi:MAG: MFS transporter, partial [Chloroflexi bacterium]|nr:MFS transporter [Chloroflexota bacterium]